MRISEIHLLSFFLITLITLPIRVSSQSSDTTSSFDKLFSPADTLYLSISSKNPIGLPTSLCLNDYSLIWGSKDYFASFSLSGELLSLENQKGRGPGEYNHATYYSCHNESSFSLIDVSQAKILTFSYNRDTNEYNLNNEFLVGPNRPKQFVFTDDYFITLNELIHADAEIPALSVYNKEGKQIKEVGQIPKSARLQFSLEETGGITKDNYGNIYYSYLGDHKIWKWTANKDSLSIFDMKPDYFKSTDLQMLESIAGNPMERVRYAFELTRVTGLFYIKPDVLIQQLEPNNYLKKGIKQKVLIELFNTDGKKKYTAIEIPQKISFTSENMIYIPVDYYSNLIEKEGRKAALIGYVYKGSK